MNTVYRLMNTVLDRIMYIFEVTVFIKRAKYEQKSVLYPPPPPRVFNM